MSSDRSDSPFPASVAALAIFLAGKAGASGLRLAENALAPFGLRPREFWTLAVLDELGDATQQQVADRQGVDRSDMVAILDKLQSMGLATRARDPHDRRKQIVQLTPKGRRLTVSAIESLAAADREFLASFTAAEKRGLRSALTRLVKKDAG